MGSVSDKRDVLDRAVALVALEYVLPWHLSELQDAARHGVQVVLTRRAREKSLGLPSEEEPFPTILRETAANGRRLRAESDMRQRWLPPSVNRIEESLEFFTAEEWSRLVSCFGGEDLHPLRKHLDARRDDLEQRLGRRKYLLVYGDVTKRAMALWARQGIRMTEVSAPLRLIRVMYLRRSLKVRDPLSAAALAKVLRQDGGEWTTRRVRLMLDRIREDERMRDFMDRGGPHPELGNDALKKLLYWAAGKYVRARHERRARRESR